MEFELAKKFNETVVAKLAVPRSIINSSPPFISKLDRKVLPIPEPEAPPIDASDIQGILDFCGLSLDIINHSPRRGVMKFGPPEKSVTIYWDKRAIVAPPEYYSRNHF